MVHLEIKTKERLMNDQVNTEQVEVLEPVEGQPEQEDKQEEQEAE